MITSPTGGQKITVHGIGPQSEVMSLSQFRDAVGYSKQVPMPAKQVTLAGVVKLAGTAVSINTTGVVNGNEIDGLTATDALIGAAVASAGIPDGTTVLTVLDPALPGQSGRIGLSNVAPFAPSTGVPQPIVFTILLRHSTISGLPVTEGLEGARVSGGGIPDKSTVGKVWVPAIVATNARPGTPGEVELVTPVLPPAAPPAPPAAVAPAAPAATAAPVTPVAVPPPAPLAVMTPVEITFAVPTSGIVIPDGVSQLQLSPTEPIDALTVTLPPNPADGQVAFIFSTLQIAELTVLANAGQKLNWSPAVERAATPPTEPAPVAAYPWLLIAPNTRIGYLYSLPNKTWDRIL